MESIFNCFPSLILPAIFQLFRIILVKNVEYVHFAGGIMMGKKSKSRRFVQYGSDSVKKHAERFPYRSRFSDVERKHEEAEDHHVGGF